MKKLTALVLSLTMIFTMLSAVPAFALVAEGETPTVNMDSNGLTIEMEDYVKENCYKHITERSPELASGGKIVTAGYSSAEAFNKEVVHIKVTQAGLFDVDAILGFGSDDSNCVFQLKDSAGKDVVYFDNVQSGRYNATLVDGLTGGDGCGKAYNVSQKKVLLNVGTYTLNFTVGLNTYRRYLVDFFRFTPCDMEGFEVNGRENQKADLDTWTLDQVGSHGKIKDDANAMGGSYGYSDWCLANVIIIPVDINKATKYDIEYVLAQASPNDDSYYGWKLSIGDTVLNNSTTAVGTSTNLTPIASSYPMKKFKNEAVSLEEGRYNVVLTLLDGASSGKHTFAADYIEFIPYAVEGEAYTAIDTFRIADGVVTAEGRILNSIGKGYEGLGAEIYLTLPDADAVKIGDVTSGADGSFSLTYTLPEDDVNGMCTLEVIAEYADPADETYEYMSSKYLLPILKEFETTSDAKGVFNTYRTQLGVDDVEDTKTLTDASLFYDAFEGKKLTSLEGFRTFYAETLVKEKINQADSMDDVKAIITNDDNVKTLGLDTDKLSALNNDGIEYTAGALYDMERADDVADFNEKFEDVIFNEALLFQFGIGTFALEADSASVKQGQTTELNIKSKTEIDNVRKIELTVEFKDDLDGEYDDLEFTAAVGQCVETDDLTFVITPEEVISVTDIAAISFIPEKVGTGKVKIKGKVTLDNETDYDAVADITAIEYTVDVAEQVKQSIGGGSSSGRGSGGVSFGGAAAVTPVPSTNVQQTAVKSYKDLDSVPWAQEAIVGLYNRQAIAMPEDGMFNPNRTITRAEFIKMVILANAMWRGADLESDFGDVSKDDWYYQYLVSAVNNGLITGDAEGNFRPADPITREDICVILARLKKVKNADMNILFADDGEISEYAKIAVYYMKEGGIVNGVGDNSFAPKSNATRAEAAKIIYGTVK